MCFLSGSRYKVNVQFFLCAFFCFLRFFLRQPFLRYEPFSFMSILFFCWVVLLQSPFRLIRARLFWEDLCAAARRQVQKLDIMRKPSRGRKNLLLPLTPPYKTITQKNYGQEMRIREMKLWGDLVEDRMEPSFINAKNYLVLSPCSVIRVPFFRIPPKKNVTRKQTLLN